MNIDIVRGSSHDYTFTITANGLPFDLTGAIIAFMVKKRAEDDDSEALFTKTLGDGINMIDPSSGVFTVRISAIDTKDLYYKFLYFECVIERSGDMLRQGVNTFTLLDNVLHENIL